MLATPIHGIVKQGDPKQKHGRYSAVSLGNAQKSPKF
jgi:hypothetical protein